MGQRLLRVSALKEDRAEVVVRARIVWINRERRAVLLERVVQPSGEAQRRPQVEMRGRGGRIEFRRRVEVGHGVLRAA